MKVVLFQHPGRDEREVVGLIPGLHEVPSGPDQVPTTIVVTAEAEVIPVLSRHVFTREGLAYAEEWATKTHKSPFEIKIPAALAVPGGVR